MSHPSNPSEKDRANPSTNTEPVPDGEEGSIFEENDSDDSITHRREAAPAREDGNEDRSDGRPGNKNDNGEPRRRVTLH